MEFCVHGVPNHVGGQFLGHNYWNDRYSLGYTDWFGFWNNYHSGRTEYKRGTSETVGRVCSSDCRCSNDEGLVCSGNPTTM